MLTFKKNSTASKTTMMDAFIISIAIFITIILIQQRFVNAESLLTDIDNEEPIDISFLGNAIYGQPDENVGERLKNSNLTNINPEELGSYLEGDILMPIPIGPRGRNGLKDDFYRWPNGIVPIEIRGPFTKAETTLINSALDSYHKKTCIRFKQRGNEKDYIVVQNTATGCWANVGRSGGAQVVNLQSSGCLSKIGTVEHEFMHALGFLHEQNREDRDNYVSINWNNIPSSTKNNFKIAATGSTNSFNVPYDYGSIMHYSAYSFSIKNNEPTIFAKESKFTKMMGQRDGFSSYDIKKIWKMYKCAKTTSSGTSGGKNNEFNVMDSLGGFVGAFFGIGDEEEIEKNTV